MEEGAKRNLVLVAEDDEDDRLLIRDALKARDRGLDLQFVGDGEELMDRLQRRGKYRRDGGPLPSLILLDLRMPKKDGYEALREIKADPDLRNIPVVALTTSSREEDIAQGYAQGLNAYIVKPSAFRELEQAMSALTDYWFGVVTLPR